MNRIKNIRPGVLVIPDAGLKLKPGQVVEVERLTKQIQAALNINVLFILGIALAFALSWGAGDQILIRIGSRKIVSRNTRATPIADISAKLITGTRLPDIRASSPTWW